MIQVNDLWKKFGRFEALRGLSFSVPEGSAFALIGANGAGKTTTIKVLMNILEPTRGSATVLGVDSRKISPKELSQIGYVSENQDMPGGLTVAEYLAYLRPCPNSPASFARFSGADHRLLISEGFSRWSMTRIPTAPFIDFSLNPSCSCRRVD